MARVRDNYPLTKFEQYTVLEQYQLQDQVRGLCFLLSIGWILHHRNHRTVFGQKKSTAARLNFLKDKGNFLSINRHHDDFLKSQGDLNRKVVGNESEKAEIGHAESLGVSLVENKPRIYVGSLGYADRDQLEDTIRDDENRLLLNQIIVTHSYHLLNLDGDQGHTVACYCSGGRRSDDPHVYFFDPNIGEFQLTASVDTLAAFIADLLLDYKDNNMFPNWLKLLTAEVGAATVNLFTPPK